MCHKLTGSKQDFDGVKMMIFLLSLFQPKIVEALLGYELIQVSCGASHVLAVTNEREVFAWGRGENGRVHQSLLFTLSRSVLQMSVSCYLGFDGILSAKLLPQLWFLLQVASGWELKTHTTLHSKCVYLWNLKLTGSYVELTAPLLSAASTAFWHAEAIGNYSAFEPKPLPLVSVSPANN